MLIAIPLAAALLAGAAPADANDLEKVAAEAIRLYDQGAYDEAKIDLEGLAAAGEADGALLYRLFYCERVTGHEDAAQKALERARVALEKELPGATSLEVPFYLANAYANLARAADAQATARAATAKIESGVWKVPESAIGLFQLGKLYQDMGRSADATRYFTKALDGFDLKGGRYASNARWALRYLGNVAFSQGDFGGSEVDFTRLTGLGDALPGDWSALAAARVRLGHYKAAGEAWKASVKLDPAGADDARYGARLADTAAEIAPLPTAAPNGTAFAAMVQADLESVLKDQAAAARAAQVKAAEAIKPAKDGATTRPLTPKLRAELTTQLKTARRVFVAAALEYAVRRLPIRETAFREGYAVLIFQDREWELPADPAPAPKGRAAKPS